MTEQVVAAGVEVRMPRLSDSMQEGTIVQWLVADGAAVAGGAEVVEIETDKATMAFESPAGGRLRIVAAVGATVTVGEVIAYVEGSGEPSRRGGTGLRISPLARRVAAERGVDLQQVVGTGPLGRILKVDVMGALRSAAVALERRGERPVSTDETAEERAPRDSTAEVVRLTRSQRLVAERMTTSRATVPDFSVRIDVDVTAANGLRELMDTPASLNDVVVFAVARTLAHHRLINGSYADDGVELHAQINVGLAVAVGDELLVPVIREADRMSLGELASAARTLIERARARQITPDELSDATFTVSNLGMFGITECQPIINPPQAAILGIGAARPASSSSANGDAPVMLTLTLVCDHRVIYGTHAARFLAEVRDVIEQPMRLLLRR